MIWKKLSLDKNLFPSFTSVLYSLKTAILTKIVVSLMLVVDLDDRSVDNLLIYVPINSWRSNLTFKTYCIFINWIIRVIRAMDYGY
ncbi:unnamed protein product [Rhizophagus irregularis]|uniref:Uncharacterized protein n=1 Tax=Rhizophagus irregularis TaxID=588596 RepID=A0A915ZM08_9GLOM|nr:unnamed protein product [Rhizophagus irregularis]